jgi:nicotinamide-nucleotide amidase
MDHHSDIVAELAEALGTALKTRGLMLATAESCTGGLASAAITQIAGSSAWFERGFVTYSNASKIEMLGVKADTLEKYGAVSEETAREMALGAIKHSHANVAISITGIAGPDGGTPAKPVGTVCFAWAYADKISSSTKKISGNRQEVRDESTVAALRELLKLLTKY